MLLITHKSKFILIIFFIINLYFENKSFKICMCTTAKYENKYIKEFIEYYIKLGIDIIYLYDNNDINGENFDFLYKYINNKYIKIKYFRGKKKPQKDIYRDCYKNNYNKYRWILFYDVDEFLYLKKYSKLKDFLNQAKFNKCQSIYLNWKIHTDNDLIYYDNRTLKTRFPKVILKKKCIGKSIIRGNIENINIKSLHLLDLRTIRCDGFGNIIDLKNIFCKSCDYKYNYIDHYKYKSTEEFIEKLNLKGDAIFDDNQKLKYSKIFGYFQDNNISINKINYISEKTGLNSSYIKNKLIINNEKTFL